MKDINDIITEKIMAESIAEKCGMIINLNSELMKARKELAEAKKKNDENKIKE